MATYLDECIESCEGQATTCPGILGCFLRKSPYQLCLASCKKGSRHITGYGEDIFNFDLGIDIDADLDAGFGTPNFGSEEETYYYESDTPDASISPYQDPKVLLAAVGLIGGLLYIGMR